MKVRFFSKAREDLRSAVEYIARHNPNAAQDVANRVLSLIERLAAGDFEGPEQRLRSGKVVRSWPVPPFRIYYQRRGDSLVILRIYHQARRPIAGSSG